MNCDWNTKKKHGKDKNALNSAKKRRLWNSCNNGRNKTNGKIKRPSPSASAETATAAIQSEPAAVIRIFLFSIRLF